jgi:membrane fusion protein (multidrug efflux system)
VAAARAAVKAAQARRADTVLHAPLDGFVTGRFLDPGAVVAPGQPILAVQHIRRVWVMVSVPEEASRSISLGQRGRVSFDAIPGRTFTGVVTQINPSADPESRQFSVRLTLDNPDFAIKPGVFAHVEIETGLIRGVTVVPREAVQRDREGSYVTVVAAGNIAKRRPVVVGASTAALIAISDGLRPGERVVTMTAYPLKNGQVVTTGGRRQGRSGRQ